MENSKLSIRILESSTGCLKQIPQYDHRREYEPHRNYTPKKPHFNYTLKKIEPKTAQLLDCRPKADRAEGQLGQLLRNGGAARPRFSPSSVRRKTRLPRLPAGV